MRTWSARVLGCADSLTFFASFVTSLFFSLSVAVVVKFPPSDSVSVSWLLLVKLTLSVFSTATVALCLRDRRVPSGSLDPVSSLPLSSSSCSTHFVLPESTSKY